MITLIIQSKKITLNEVKNKYALLEPSYCKKKKKKLNELLLANPINWCSHYGKHYGDSLGN